MERLAINPELCYDTVDELKSKYMKLAAIFLGLATALTVGSGATACRESVNIYRSFTGTVSHHSYPIGSTHTLIRGNGRIMVTVGSRSQVQGFHLPDSLMGRLGFTSQINSGTACLN